MKSTDIKPKRNTKESQKVEMVEVEALYPCNGGGQKMTVGKKYKVPTKDARFLRATGKAKLVETVNAAKDAESVEKADKAKAAAAAKEAAAAK